jgi:2-phospho-L-lactate/phosphoenolpyruvate guanylyltransferase
VSRPGKQQWSIVVPVKRTSTAKSRLGGPFAPLRAKLALAFAEDTVTAALGCSAVALVVVVTDDAGAGEVLAAQGALVVPDQPDAGLNAAFRYGAAEASRRQPGCGVAAVQADLPALTPAVLAVALRSASRHRTAFVADADGTGTTLYAAGAATDFAPHFGPASRAAHLDAGAVELALDGIAALRRDVDTEDDLRQAVALGVGLSTALALRG